MPALAPPVTNERDLLLAYLAQQRDAFRFAVHGLSDEQARSKPSVSAMSLAGLIKHVASVEWFWLAVLVDGQPMPSAEGGYEDTFAVGPDQTVAALLERYAGVAAETERIVRAIPDLGRPVPVPKDVPWFPKDVEAWSVRWVLLHVIEETARHAGHADIIREALDGATMYPLMAAAEGWLADLQRMEAEYAAQKDDASPAP
jgi:uncharacterized damage-inducible protein DinB